MKELIQKNIIKLFNNVFSLFVVKGAELLITLILIPIIIQKIGILLYGHYVYVFAYAMFFVNILGYGFDLSAVRDISIAENNKELTKVFNEVVSVKILLFVIVSILYFGIGYFFFRNDNRRLDLLIYAFSLVLGEFLSFRWFYYGILKNGILALVSFFSTIMFFYSIFFQLREGGENFFVIPFYKSMGFIILGVYVFFYTLKKYKIKFELLRFDECIYYLKLHFISFVNLLIPSIISNTVVFFTGALSSPINASISQLAIRFVNVFSTLNTILSQVLFPFVNKVKKAFTASAILLCFTGFVVSFFMYITSNYLVEIWLAAEEELTQFKVVDLIKIMSLTPLLMAIISSYGINGLIVRKKDLMYFGINLFIVTITLVFCFLIKYFNYLAAAVILILIRLLYAIIVYGSFKRID